MKIYVWEAITDGGDGEHHAHQYKSKQEMIDDLSLTDVDDGDYGTALDEYYYVVSFNKTIFDTDGFEVVE
jgi:hypothetical protein